VGSEIGQWMQYRLSRSNNSETDHPSAEQKAGIPEKKEGEQMKPNSRNVVTKLYACSGERRDQAGLTFILPLESRHGGA
jgi:hypothetical protein